MAEQKDKERLSESDLGGNPGTVNLQAVIHLKGFTVIHKNIRMCQCNSFSGIYEATIQTSRFPDNMTYTEQQY